MGCPEESHGIDLVPILVSKSNNQIDAVGAMIKQGRNFFLYIYILELLGSDIS
jgi:hypothetical protein